MDDLRKDIIAHLKSVSPLGLPGEWLGDVEEIKPLPAVVESDALPLTKFSHLDFDALREEALGCTRCRLCETRKNVVFGVGNATRPQVCFVGEGPGADEDQQGEPFVGKAGALLTAAITKGMGLKREDVYICNVVKCRPPGNRTPLPDEVEQCSEFLYRQLELIQPRVIVTLGAPAQLALSGKSGGITRIRGNWLEWRGFRLMPTFHPAYILRNQSAKRPFWEDLQEVMRELGLESNS